MFSPDPESKTMLPETMRACSVFLGGTTELTTMNNLRSVLEEGWVREALQLVLEAAFINRMHKTTSWLLRGHSDNR